MRLAATAPALALALAAAPALAQNLPGQFAGAARAFTLPGVESLARGDQAEDEAIMALLPGLAGDWVALDVLFPDPLAFDPELLASACALNPATLTPVAARSFELRRTTERDGVPISLGLRYDWVVGNGFDRGAPEDEIIAYLGFDGQDEVPPGLLIAPHLRGPAQVFHPSPDVLVIVAPHQAPEFWGRCPA